MPPISFFRVLLPVILTFILTWPLGRGFIIAAHAAEPLTTLHEALAFERQGRIYRINRDGSGLIMLAPGQNPSRVLAGATKLPPGQTPPPSQVGAPAPAAKGQ